jgi:hypothetical protein
MLTKNNTKQNGGLNVLYILNADFSVNSTIVKKLINVKFIVYRDRTQKSTVNMSY